MCPRVPPVQASVTPEIAIMCRTAKAHCTSRSLRPEGARDTCRAPPARRAEQSRPPGEAPEGGSPRRRTTPRSLGSLVVISGGRGQWCANRRRAFGRGARGGALDNCGAGEWGGAVGSVHRRLKQRLARVHCRRDRALACAQADTCFLHRDWYSAAGSQRSNL